MPLTTEQRIELLKKAREAKAKKKAEQDALKPVPVRGRPAKERKEERTLDLNDNNQVKDEELDDILKSEPEPEPKPKISKRTTKKEKVVPQQVQEPEIVEEVEVRKIKKPKRRIVRKIIKEQYDSESTEEEIEEVVYKAPTYRSKARAKQVEQPRPPTPPREQEIREPKPSLNIFGY